jgi:hypothetical protein
LTGTGKISVTLWIYAYQAAEFEALKRIQAAQEKAEVDLLVSQGRTKRQARILVARMRPDRWPPLETLVAAAIEQRLAEPDMAGPWEALTEAEEEELALSGRWPGPSLGISMVQRNYKLSVDLVTRLRTAAWRRSERPMRELHARGLVGAGLVLTDAQKAVRDELAAQLYPVPRIVREALARYESTTPDE